MQFDMKKILLTATILALFPVIIQARTIWRWMNIPRHRPPQVHKTRLGGAGLDTSTIPFNFEPEPVKTLLKKIHRSFPETEKKAEYQSSDYLPKQSSMVIEELAEEAEDLFQESIKQKEELASISKNITSSPVTQLNPDSESGGQ